MIKEFARLIEALTPSEFVVGDRIQVGHRLPTSPVRCSVILETAGGAVYGDVPDMVDKAFQILSRGETYFTARDDAWVIFEALHGTAGWNLPVVDSGITWWVASIDAYSDPAYIGQDEKGYFEFSANYIVRLRRDSCGP
jgi:hypothetical protein